MSYLTQFMNRENLTLLWEVLLDELKINTSNKNIVNNIKTVFDSNIKPFTSRANAKSNIMELNKLFLSQVVIAVNRLFPNMSSMQNQEQNIKRITISDEDIEPYKIEDIQSSRQNNFEKEVERKRLDLENYMSPQKPSELDFSDRNSDGKIKAMDTLVADKMAERNLEFETFQNNNYNTTDPNKWLTPKETSVKVEKQNSTLEPIKNNSRLKHISIDSNNVILTINEQETKSKKVSWDDLHEEQNDTIFNIFNKLKKQPIEQIHDDFIAVAVTDNKQYIEQKSIPLPIVKHDEIIRNQSTLITPTNEPVLPKTEIIKQLNEMNKKIDSLYELVYKLVNNMTTNEIIHDKNIILDQDQDII